MAKTCPTCTLINPDAAETCDCGHDFRTKTKSLHYLRKQQIKRVSIWGTILGSVVWAFGKTLNINAIMFIAVLSGAAVWWISNKLLNESKKVVIPTLSVCVVHAIWMCSAPGSLDTSLFRLRRPAESNLAWLEPAICTPVSGPATARCTSR